MISLQSGVVPSFGADDVWKNALQEVMDNGINVAPRGQACRELRGTTIRLFNPCDNVIVSRTRKLNYHFMVAEWVWMLLGRADVATIAAFNKNIAQFSDNGKTFFGAYGSPITRQLPLVIKLLKRDPHTRQAIVQIYREDALVTETKDVPCTLTWQFFIRHGRLEMHVNMRSNDLWLGFPYDLFNFTQFQRLVASALSLPCGEYVHHVGSLHIYERNFEAVDTVLGSTMTTDSPHALRRPFTCPTWPAPHLKLSNLLDYLTQDEYTDKNPDEVVGALVDEVDAPWLEYAEVLAHRFFKQLALPVHLRRLVAP